MSFEKCLAYVTEYTNKNVNRAYTLYMENISTDLDIISKCVSNEVVKAKLGLIEKYRQADCYELEDKALHCTFIISLIAKNIYQSENPDAKTCIKNILFALNKLVRIMRTRELAELARMIAREINMSPCIEIQSIPIKV
ncbi:hypothetical protein ACE38W_02245 [Chitinophaga sp. Hz27]|uniref:hypothetical protein n=1 Tax=Chitinophaga sp. Hz27 TaxID=3347169 RepID=UPI0035DEED0C